MAAYSLDLGERSQDGLHELGDTDGGHQNDDPGSVEQATDDGPLHDGAYGDAN